MADGQNTEYVCTLSPELVKKAQEELNEKPEWRSRDIQALREMVLKEKALRIRTDDAYLLRFLRAKKFDYERAFNLIMTHFKMKVENPEIFNGLRPSAVKMVLEAGVTGVLPNRDKLGRKVIMFRPGMAMDNLYWSWIPGLPRKVKWPVKVVDWEATCNSKNDMVTVYCRADDAYFETGRKQLIPFLPGNGKSDGISNKCIELLKKRPETLKAFKEDLKWMIKSLEEYSPRLSSVNMVKPMTSDPITELTEDSVKPVSSPTSIEITNASLITDSSQQTAITTLAIDSAQLTSLTPMTSDPITELAEDSVKPVSSPTSIEITNASLITDSSQQTAITTLAIDSAQLTSLTPMTSDPITELTEDSVKPVSIPTSIEITNASLITDSSQQTAITTLAIDSAQLTSLTPMTSDPITELAEDSVKPVSSPTSIEITNASLITDSSQQTAITTLAIDSAQLTSLTPMTSDPITELAEDSVKPVSSPTSIEITNASLITDSSQQTAITTLAIDSAQLTSLTPMTSDPITELTEDSVKPVSSPTSIEITNASLITDSSQQTAITTLAIDSAQLTSLTPMTSDPITELTEDSVKPVSSPTSIEITNASLITDSSQQTAITTLAIDSAQLTSLTPMTSDPITELTEDSVKPVSSPTSIEITNASLITDSSQQTAITTLAIDSAQLTSLTPMTSDPITELTEDSVKPVSSPTSIEITNASLITDSSQQTAITTLAIDSAQLTSLTPMTSDPITELTEDSVKPVFSATSIEFTTDLIPMDIFENLNDYEVFSDDLDEELSNLESNKDDDESSYLVSDSDITDSDSASVIYHLPGLSSKTHCIPESDVDMRDENTESDVDTIDENTENEENILSNKDTESDKGEIASDDNSLSESEKLRSTDKPSIFVRKVLKSAVKKTKQKKKGLRVYNSYHACFYCGLVVQHVGPHLKKKHDIEDLKNLRQKGDHKHNLKVVENGKGELLLSRRPKKAFRSDDYGPCPICMDWLLKSTLQRHQKSCIGVKGDEEKNSKRTLIMKSDIISGRFYTQSEGSKQLREEVFSKMKNDNVSKVAQNDYLIVQLAESCLKRSLDNKLKRANYASERMRLSAKMLLELRSLENSENESSESKEKSRSLEKSENESSENKEKSMWEFLTTTSFDNLAQAAINVSLPQMDDTEDLKSPSNAIKLKYDLIKLINIKWASILKSTDHENDEQQKGCKALKNLLHLFRVQWGEKVTKLARTVLIQRSFQKVTDIPSPEDIKKLNDHVKQELKMLKDDDSSPEYFKKAVTLVQTRLLLFNKRRSGEIDAISLKDYANMRTQLSDVDRSLVGELSSLEKHLLDTQDLMVVRGKRCRPVPVIIPEDVKEPLKKIADYHIRKKSLIKSSNKHLFASSGDGPVRCYDSLKVVSDGLNLANPERITSVSLRKYTATLSQVLNLEDGELSWLCRHLGHTKRVHLNSYRQMSGFLERVEISKLMLIQDNNLIGKFKGKKLEEINIKDILQEDVGKDRLHGDLNENEQNNDSDEPEDREEIFSFAEEKVDNDDDDDDSCTSSPRKKIRKTNRVKWTPQEEEELQKYFAEHFKTKTVPGKKSCLKAIEKSKKNNGQIHRRKYPTIVKKISNMNKKCD